jgi:hypothetical protein
VLERQVRVLELKAAGLTFRTIASMVGVSASQAHRDFWCGFDPAKVRERELGRRLLRDRLLSGGPNGRVISYKVLALDYGLPVAKVRALVRDAADDLQRALARQAGPL